MVWHAVVNGSPLDLLMMYLPAPLGQDLSVDFVVSTQFRKVMAVFTILSLVAWDFLE